MIVAHNLESTRTKRRKANRSWLVHLPLALGAILFIIPFIWMILTSVKTLGESTLVPPVIFPASPQWSNYPDAAATLPFGVFYFNTVVMTVGRTLGQLVFCSLAAYAFARIEFPGRNFLFLLMLSVLMV